jgi:GST-like protein
LRAAYKGRDDLVPGPGAPGQAALLRWLVFLVTNIYPTFTYADDPSRFVSVEAAQVPFRAAVNDYGKRLWAIVEGEAGAPCFLGTRFPAIDLCIGVMRHWRPNPDWYAAHAPKLNEIALKAQALKPLEEFWQRNFPEA